MKTIFSLCLALLVTGSAQAQILRPGAGHGAGRGETARSAIGHRSSHDRAIVGARHSVHRAHPATYARARFGHYGAPRFGSHRPHRPGYLHHPYGHGSRIAYRPYYSIGYHPGFLYGYPAYDVGYPYYRGSYSAQGLWLGAVAGGIIGHNSGAFRHQAWRGAAWGAGTGWLLGAFADAHRPAATHVPSVIVQPDLQPAAGAAPQHVTIINNVYHAPATPMSGANSLFGR